MPKLMDRLRSGNEPPEYIAIVRWLWYALLAGIGVIALIFILLSFSNLPSVRQLENPRTNEATQVYAANGEVLGRYFTENRVPVTFDELDQDLVNALIATEDERYYQHSGIDFKALFRVAIKTVLLRQSSAGGASTITQQLAKQLFTVNPGSGFERVVQKLKEWIIAIRLERKYTKEEIIAMYLNKFDFINDAYGIKAAAETYFSKPQDSLEVQEAAMLIGMLKNPFLYHPLRRQELTKKRREIVLYQMAKNGIITQEAYDSLRVLPLGIKFNRRSHLDGIATYFRMELAKDVRAILQQYNEQNGTDYNLYRDGLKIYTTIDPDMQRLAEAIMQEHMLEQQEIFLREWRNKDPWTYIDYDEDNEPQGVPVSIRQEGLQRLIRISDRYQGLRQEILGDIITILQEEVSEMEFNPDDREIIRMLREYQNRGHLDTLVNTGIISRQRAARYREVMRSPNFPRLRTQWDVLQERSKEAFNTPVEMKVFTYENDQMEKDTVMTPLDSIKYHRMFLQTGIMAVDPRTGHVKVWIGGINHKYFQFDHVRTNRQVGSTFKPFVYATAIDQQGISPCFQVYDLPQTIRPGDGNFFLPEEWTPQNFDGQYTGQLFTLKEGLAKSKNTVSVYLMKQLGDVEPVRNLVHNMGIDTSARYFNGQYRLPKVPAICLGATDLSVLEMTGAYTTFANQGIHTAPIFVTRIEDKNGIKIYQGIQQENLALNPNSNYVMVEMLRYAGGFGRSLTSDVGGKTGTTNDFVDGWFMGITPTLVVGTWVGGEDRWIHFRTPYNGQGSRMAKPFFRQFLLALQASETINYDKFAIFPRPPDNLDSQLNCDKYLRDTLPTGEDLFEQDIFSEDQFGDEIHNRDPFGNR